MVQALLGWHLLRHDRTVAIALRKQQICETAQHTRDGIGQAVAGVARHSVRTIGSATWPHSRKGSNSPLTNWGTTAPVACSAWAKKVSVCCCARPCRSRQKARSAGLHCQVQRDAQARPAFVAVPLSPSNPIRLHRSGSSTYKYLLGDRVVPLFDQAATFLIGIARRPRLIPRRL